MNGQRKYTFIPVSECQMCKSGSDQFRVLGKRLNRAQGKKPAKRSGITVSVCKCRNCGLIFSNPMPLPENFEDHYAIPPESYWKESYFQDEKNYFQGAIKILNSLMPFQSGMRSLDIGAGLGKQMKALEAAGFEAFGFEPSPPFYERAISKMKIDPEKLKLASIEEAVYPENHFDFISFGAVLEHLAEPSISIEKALTWLKPNGILHIEVPSSDWLIARMANIYYKMIGTDYVGNLSPMHEPFHLFEFTLKSFEVHARLFNYKIAHHDYYIGDTYLPGSLSSIVRPVMKWTNTGMQLCVWLQKKG